MNMFKHNLDFFKRKLSDFLNKAGLVKIIYVLEKYVMPTPSLHSNLGMRDTFQLIISSDFSLLSQLRIQSVR